VTALSYANYAAPALYAQAFFALSNGFERSIKLGLMVDHAQNNHGQFMSSRELFALGHKIDALFDRADELAIRLNVSAFHRSQVHQGIIEVLTLFADNRTRYYNLDLLAGRAGTETEQEPMAHWFKVVVEPLLAKHYSEERRHTDEARATLFDQMIGHSCMVIHTAEDGSQINDIFAGAMQSAKVDFARPYVRLAVLQLARFLASIFDALTTRSYGLRMEQIPHLSEFLALYNAPDKDLKSRKIWSTYRP
jgi:hypothetical protein